MEATQARGGTTSPPSRWAAPIAAIPTTSCRASPSRTQFCTWSGAGGSGGGDQQPVLHDRGLTRALLAWSRWIKTRNEKQKMYLGLGAAVVGELAIGPLHRAGLITLALCGGRCPALGWL